MPLAESSAQKALSINISLILRYGNDKAYFFKNDMHIYLRTYQKMR